jgi:excisionase family DNA binding protein
MATVDPSRLDDLPPFLTVPEAARLLRMSRASAYEAVIAGRIPTVSFGPRTLRVPRAALLRLAGEHPVSAPAEPAPDQREPVAGGIKGHAANRA